MHIYIIELIGTFFLTVALTFTANPLAIGFMYMTMLFIGHAYTRSYYNPAIGLSLFLKRSLEPEHTFGCITAQCIGALLANMLFAAITGVAFMPEIVPGMALWINSLMELLLTAVLCFATLTALYEPENPFHMSMIIGFSLLGLSSIGGIFNPAIALGVLIQNLMLGNVIDLTHYIVSYIISPLLGGALAAFSYRWFSKNHYRNTTKTHSNIPTL